MRRVALTPELQNARRELVPTFTHFLDLPILFIIIALGAMQPTSWTLFFTGSLAAIISGSAAKLIQDPSGTQL